MEKDISTSSTILIILTLIILGGITAFIILKNEKDVSASSTKTYEESPSTVGQPIMGNEKSPISFLEFGDYKCPACKRWEDTILPKLKKDFIDTGKIKFSFVNVIFHGKESTLPSLAAESVYIQTPNLFWKFHKSLYDEQNKELTIEQILEVSSKINGIKRDELEQAIIYHKTDSEIEKDKKLVSKFKIRQTPTIFINNIQIEDPFDYKQIKIIIQKELKETYEQ